MDGEYRKPWVQRHWLLLLVLGVGLTMLLSLGVGAALVYRLMEAGKQTPPYRMAMERVRADARVGQALGEPYAERWVPIGGLEGERAGFLIFLRGPRSQGTLNAEAVREGDRWRLQELTLNVDGPPRQPPIDLLREPGESATDAGAEPYGESETADEAAG